jgi:plasmid stabilization system protein ParE
MSRAATSKLLSSAAFLGPWGSLDVARRRATDLKKRCALFATHSRAGPNVAESKAADLESRSVLLARHALSVTIVRPGMP